MFLYSGERLALAEGFHSAASEHSPEGCVSQDGCILCSGGAAGCPGLSCRAVTLDRAAWEVCGQLGKEKASLSEFGNSSAELELQSRVC